VSGLRAALQEQLARFDDEAFVALANKGLLRRALKDLENGLATIEDEDDTGLRVRFGPHLVAFDARGPAQARCSCPAAGVCQHILAAAISLQRLAAATPVTPAAEVAGDAAPVARLVEALLALAQPELERHAGRAGYRWAWQFVQDMASDEDISFGGDLHLVIEFKHPRLRLRYMGGKLDALIADSEIRQLEKYRVAAVLALRRAHGASVPEPAPAAKPRTAALDLGKDHALPAGSDDAQALARGRLRAAATQLVQECVGLGLSHLSPAVRDRFATMAVWAQGAQYYRLALLLRRVADHVELLLERAGGADEHRLLDELALTQALVAALAHAQQRGAAPVHLVGRARTDYEGAAPLELLGLGAHAWRSPAGYVGLTMLFWSPEHRCFHSCTDARPQTQRGFDPVARYRAPGPWSGLGSPAQATGRRVRLLQAQLNAQGRLSASEATGATLEDAPDLAAQLQAATDWAALGEAHAAARRSLLAEARPLQDWCVLAPARFGVPEFDAASQALRWPLFDASGRVLLASLRYSAHTEHAIQRIEQAGKAPLPAGTLVVGRLEAGAAPLALEPLSLVRSGRPVQVDALHFDAADESWASKWLARLRGAGEPAPQVEPAVAVPLPRELLQLRQWLRTQAERGVADEALRRIEPAMREHARRCAAAGLTALAGVMSLPAAPSVLLKATYACMQLERLWGAGDEAPD
jgi:hypothetical protein